MQRMHADADADDADDADDANAKFCDTYIKLTLSFYYRSSKHIGEAISLEPFVSSTKMATRPPTLHSKPWATSTSWRALNLHGTSPSLRI